MHELITNESEVVVVGKQFSFKGLECGRGINRIKWDCMIRYKVLRRMKTTL